VVRLAQLRRYVSSEHFSVDGTLLNAWASHKSFRPKDGLPPEGPAGRNGEVAWHGQKRSPGYRRCPGGAPSLVTTVAHRRW
jgi:hypothetical protein